MWPDVAEATGLTQLERSRTITAKTKPDAFPFNEVSKRKRWPRCRRSFDGGMLGELMVVTGMSSIGPLGASQGGIR